VTEKRSIKLLAFSEHYFPRMGGTVNYVHETLCALVEKGVDAELWVPGPMPPDWLPEGMAEPPYRLRWIDADFPAQGDPSREQRYDFCHQVDALARKRIASSERPDFLHVLFGLFVMEVLDTDYFRKTGVPCGATVHNIPPLECRQVAHNAPLSARLKDALRIKAVTWKNRARLQKHPYDLYVVPSQQVHGLLAPIVGDARIEIIGHGPTTILQSAMLPPPDRRPAGLLHLLTVGGYAPHKRQHLIPATAELLVAKGVNFVWNIVGPASRISGYFDNIQSDVVARNLSKTVCLHQAVPFADLSRHYDQANLYVQPSIEEGFCITALDAAAAGLPVIGSQAGALPDIIKASRGQLVASEARMLADAIFGFNDKNLWQDGQSQGARIKSEFSWAAAAQELKNCIRGLLPANGNQRR
jgi:glycosyltransferase involved in cell wall biosynthesis